MHFMNSFNRFAGKWMAVIAPLCLCAGVLFCDPLGKLTFLVPFVFAFMTFCGAQNSSFGQLLKVVRHPLPLIVSLALIHVLIPLIALSAGKLFFSTYAYLIAGIVLEFVVPSAVVSFMWSTMTGGNASLTLSVLLTDTLLAPFIVPISLHVLVGANIHMDISGMMRDLVWMIAAPALLALVLNLISDGQTGKKLSPLLAPYSKIALIFIISVNSTRIAPFVRHMNPLLFEITGAMLLISIIGYILGGLAAFLLHRGKGVIVSMVFGCGMRNISAGAVIAAAYFPAETMFPVMIGTLFQQVLASTFSHLLIRRYGEPQ